MRVVFLSFLLSLPPLLAAAEVPASDGILWCTGCGQVQQDIAAASMADGCPTFSVASGTVLGITLMTPTLERLLSLSEAKSNPPFTPTLFAN